MTVRTFDRTDLPELYRIWNGAFPDEGVSEERFKRTVIDEPNFSPDGLFVAEEGNRIVGFLNAVYRRVPIVLGYEPDNDGYINAFAVRAGWDVKAVGSALLACAERYLSLNGKRRITTGYYPLYLNQGVGVKGNEPYLSLYDEHGYSGARSVSTVADLSGFVPDTEQVEAKRRALTEKGFLISGLRNELIPSLLDPKADFSSPSWSAEFGARLSDDGASRFRICEKDGVVVAACVFGDPNSDGGRFGPFGVSRDLRGLGIGTVLLSDTLCEMKRRGIRRAWMQWVSTSGAAFHMYEKVGFTVDREYCTFSKALV